MNLTKLFHPGWKTCPVLALSLMFAGTSEANPCPDPDGSGSVGVNDLLAVLSDWGPCPGTCVGDLDGNGIVGIDDLLAVLGGWGPCPDTEGEGPYNYGEALQKAMAFYYAQRAGDLPDDYPLDWRGDCFDYELEQLNGQYPVGPEILNRYMDAGDSPTFVLPISSAMTTMAWSGVDFNDGFQSAGLMDELKDTLRWHADWCIAAHPEPNVFCGQIGLGNASHGFWGPAEVHTIANGYRPKIWWLSPEHPGSEPAAEAAAFLAAASMLFSDEPAYAAELLQHARELYSFADTHRGNYTDSIPEVASFYNSWSGYHDELTWAAAWLHRATGEQDYLDRAEAHYDQAGPDQAWAQTWDGKINGAAVLLASLTGRQKYIDYVEGHLGYWMPGGGIAYTPGGLSWLDQWGSLRYAANTSFIAFAYAELVGDTPDGRYRSYGEQQINYILGDNPRNSSYVCGFGANPPLSPHHRGAHGSWNNDIGDSGPNRHVLWGALVGGPASPDDFDYVDDRGDWIANEVACDYNAGFVAALGRMSLAYGGSPLPESEFPPAGDSYGNEMFVEASIIESGDDFVRLRCLLNNRSAWPARWSDALSYRIYLDLSEVIAAGFGPDDVEVDGGFLDGGTVGDLQVANAGSDLYFFEVGYPGVAFGPGEGADYRRECQVRVGLVAGVPASAWDVSNDPSIAGLPVGQSAIVKTGMIAVFDGGVLVYGEEGSLDCNDNGIDDAEEIGGGAQDLDGNGVPDECEPDCDDDGVPDAFEIEQGAADCDADGLPDQCQSFDDCNGNGVGDSCEIAEGGVSDCNANGVPDACDIDQGAEDLDGDGVLDACQVEGIQWLMVADDQWDGGFVAQFTIVNQTGQSISNWDLVLQAGFQVDSAWNAVLVGQQGGVVELRHEEWNGTIEDGQSIQFGFQGSGPFELPASVTVNGNPADPG
tara:strand:+ start:5965 stop:8757 length:2793 start_codon:yes stop_codon:yes gene_type:complete